MMSKVSELREVIATLAVNHPHFDYTGLLKQALAEENERGRQQGWGECIDNWEWEPLEPEDG
jgi:hypothetical protein